MKLTQIQESNSNSKQVQEVIHSRKINKPIFRKILIKNITPQVTFQKRPSKNTLILFLDDQLNSEERFRMT